ncbi:ABC transporter substrate-binding protein [Nocardia sp. NBC_01503]|uniref:ABC transporter substrate-binding protein n=1 Tax=Nocardia sp. NBC_01503 TaxID=2975997 RepID=UPI002E7B25AF|nr:ABC transporter substrate-binding protein [Nocardia sp. NBC_01503]WTL33038.1 ABC transporter substrate-binding protein [Nocardia sp. NBC_01503]
MPVRESASTRITFASTTAPVRRLRTWGAVLAAAAVLPAGLLAGCSKGTDDAMSSIVRTTTNIAGAGVVGLERDTRTACPLPSAPDASSGTITVTHAAGTSEVPADPKRVVVLSTAALDAVCALGLWERVVGAATVSGPTAQPAYLGTGISEVPGVGMVGSPDPAKVAELKPDLILGAASDRAMYDALKGIAPTVLTGSDNGWQAEFTGYGAALDRKTAAAKALDDYRTAARDTGKSVAASLSQASVLRFDPKAVQVQGNNSFAGLVLADAGVQRPQSQRGDSFDIASLGAEADRDKVEGDIIYLMFDGKDGQKYAESVMHGDDWKSLSAVSDRREFVVEDSIWHGSGVTAARALLDDLRKSLNAYVTD